MAKRFIVGVALVLTGAGAGWAQSSAPASVERGDAGLRSGNITSTGATVPNPGASQSAGVTALDKGIQNEDTRIQSSICKGC